MPRYFIELSYNGSAYHGWQFQPREISVQQTLQEAMSLIFKEKISLIGCGRTDSGVHANQYFAHFNTDKILEEDVSYKINALLPNDIAIKRYWIEDKLHARFDAIDRTYKYFVHFRKNPFLVDNSYYLRQFRPDFKLMNETAQFLIGDHDFSTFEKRGGDNETSNCILTKAVWEQIDEERWVFTITSNRFLRNMVRSITGALISVGIGKKSQEELLSTFNNKTLIKDNLAVPANGLFLWSIRYPFEEEINE